MNIQEIHHEIDELKQLVESWEQIGSIPLIESDILLAKLSRLYEGIKFMSSQPPMVASPILEEEVERPDAAEEEENQSSNNIIFAIDLDEVVLDEVDSSNTTLEEEEEEIVESQVEVVEIEEMEEPKPTTIEDEEEEEVEVEVEEPEINEITPEPQEEEPTQKKQEEEVVTESPTPTIQDNVLFAMEPVIPKQSRRRRSVFMSLYKDEKTPTQPTVEEQIHTTSTTTQAQEDQPAVTQLFGEPVLTLADTLSSDIETVADKLATESPRQVVVSDKLGYSSFEELGINEQYLLARDLFNEDSSLCRDTLQTISAFDNYDDAVIYITENFNWNSESEGTKLILSVLENRFNIR